MNKPVINSVSMQDVNIQNLDDASDVVKYLIKTHSREEIIKNAGVDKNVLYRLEHNQNVTLENFLKIKRCYPEIFLPDTTTVGEIPIMGQISGSNVLPCNPSQPKVFNALAKAIVHWSPCIAFLNNQPNAFSGTVRVFSTKNIDHSVINYQCYNRLIIIYPENQQPKFGMLRPNIKLTAWELLDVYTGQVLLEGKVGDTMSWWRYTFTSCLYMMENEATFSYANNKSDKYNLDNTEDWYSKLDL